MRHAVSLSLYKGQELVLDLFRLVNELVRHPSSRDEGERLSFIPVYKFGSFAFPPLGISARVEHPFAVLINLTV
jgi:hypothetical protein